MEQRHPAAADLLRLCAFLAPDAIPEELLTADPSVLGPVLVPIMSDVFLRNEVISALCAYSLIRRDPTERRMFHKDSSQPKQKWKRDDFLKKEDLKSRKGDEKMNLSSYGQQTTKSNTCKVVIFETTGRRWQTPRDRCFPQTTLRHPLAINTIEIRKI